MTVYVSHRQLSKILYSFENGSKVKVLYFEDGHYLSIKGKGNLKIEENRKLINDRYIRIQNIKDEQNRINEKKREVKDEIARRKKEYESLYCTECWEFMYVGALPDDAEEVLVATSYGSVALDTFYIDEECCCYFENYCDEDDVIAWARIPKPHKEKK